MPTLDPIVADKVLKATCPEDLFGAKTDADALKAVYNQLIVSVHPDHFVGSKDQRLANEVFIKLTHLRGVALQKIKAGTYGNRVMAPPPPSMDLSIEVGGKKYLVKEKVFEGDICDLYACDYNGEDVLFKVAQAASENDLVENEAKILKQLYPEGQADENFYRYLPKVIDSFMLKGKTNRRVVVLPWFKQHRSLAEVLRIYPQGLDFRDMVWMFKRTLVGIGFAHTKGVVHGAVLPTHVLVHPTDHGAKIIDWSYSPGLGEPIRVMNSDYQEFYPPEVLAKKPATSATDIYMAAKCAVALVGGNVASGRMPDSVPPQLRAFFQGCLLLAPAQRPNNAWDLHKEFDELLKRVVGKSAYRPLKMP
jgi:serine/threonine protein kinase